MNTRRLLSKLYNTLDPPQAPTPIPKYELRSKHLRNVKVLTDRERMIELLPRNGVVAEIGVDEGNFSQSILSTGPAKLHLVDLWGSERFNDAKKQQVQHRFAREIATNKVQVHIGFSHEVAVDFPDRYFDWIYIDTDHSYETTLKELMTYLPKMKQNGVIAGHDYILGNWDGGIRYGVIEAVHEFCVKHDWELIHLTSELHINPSFAIRRIGQ